MMDIRKFGKCKRCIRWTIYGIVSFGILSLFFKPFIFLFVLFIFWGFLHLIGYFINKDKRCYECESYDNYIYAKKLLKLVVKFYKSTKCQICRNKLIKIYNSARELYEMQYITYLESKGKRPTREMIERELEKFKI